MKKLLLIGLLVFICGCAALQQTGEEIGEIHQTGEAQNYVSASRVILDDFVKSPYEELAALGIGYGLALLRRMYKKKMGSKG